MPLKRRVPFLKELRSLRFLEKGHEDELIYPYGLLTFNEWALSHMIQRRPYVVYSLEGGTRHPWYSLKFDPFSICLAQVLFIATALLTHSLGVSCFHTFSR